MLNYDVLFWVYIFVRSADIIHVGVVEVTSLPQNRECGVMCLGSHNRLYLPKMPPQLIFFILIWIKADVECNHCLLTPCRTPLHCFYMVDDGSPIKEISKRDSLKERHFNCCQHDGYRWRKHSLWVWKTRVQIELCSTVTAWAAPTVGQTKWLYLKQ